MSDCPQCANLLKRLRGIVAGLFNVDVDEYRTKPYREGYISGCGRGIKAVLGFIRTTFPEAFAAPEPVATGKPVCQTCGGTKVITCDDYPCTNPEKCAWGEVCKDGKFPCPDCGSDRGVE